MMTDSGHELRENNERIVKLISQLRKQRREMNFLIEKQELEKGRIQTEIEKLSFKLSLLTKSLSQRLVARTNYDKTIYEIETNYGILVRESSKLLKTINKDVTDLEQIMDKKTGTSGGSQSSQLSISDNLNKKNQSGEENKIIIPRKSGSDQQKILESEEEEEEEVETEPDDDIIEEEEEEMQNQIPPQEPPEAFLTDKPAENEITEESRNRSSLHTVSSIGGEHGFEYQTPEDAQKNRKSQSSHRSRHSKSIDSSIITTYATKPDKVINDEIQSYGEAYEKQHSVPLHPKLLGSRKASR